MNETERGALTRAYQSMKDYWPGFQARKIGPKAIAAASLYTRASLAELMQETGRQAKKMTDPKPR